MQGPDLTQHKSSITVVTYFKIRVQAKKYTHTPPKTNMTIKHPPWMKMYHIFPIENGGFSSQSFVSFQGCFLKKKLQAFLENMGGASTVSSPPASTRERLQSKELLLSTLCLRAWSRSSSKAVESFEPLGWGPLNNQPHIHLILRGYLFGPIYPYKRLLGRLNS